MSPRRKPDRDITTKTTGPKKLGALRECSREEMEHATAVVMQNLGDSGASSLADLGPASRTVLEALFAPAGPARPPHGVAKGNPERVAFLGRARAYFAEQGRPLAGVYVSPEREREYVAATGDRWQGVGS